uniref:Secreted protein n=1 Tax=Nelumbo nucifera TaxID=4432 RepID=A0A822Z752_NELNU|nr:TPA_asm: hypothetical protein HUJ06_000454 [Nelumbo nucifera]
MTRRQFLEFLLKLLNFFLMLPAPAHVHPKKAKSYLARRLLLAVHQCHRWFNKLPFACWSLAQLLFILDDLGFMICAQRYARLQVMALLFSLCLQSANCTLYEDSDDEVIVHPGFVRPVSVHAKG